MREIKFRAWDKSQKHMAYQGTPDLETLQSFIHHYGDEILMQFTGLTDSTGRDIYEGDFVQHDAWDYPFEVIFDNSKARFVLKLKTGLTQFIDNDRLIIIGNIYENENLIK
jgi:hypothetical protein